MSHRGRKLKKEIQIVDAKTQRRIYFFNEVSNSGLLSFIRASKAFVYPSLAEGFGIPPLEAAAAKIPVLCSNETAMSDFTFFAPNHINFNKNTDVSISLQKLLAYSNQTRLEQISKLIKKQYSWTKTSMVIESIIKK